MQEKKQKQIEVKQKIIEKDNEEEKKEANKTKQDQPQQFKLQEFLMVDIRIGSIQEVWKHPQSENLYCQKINLTEETPREIASGLQKFVPIQQMKGPVVVMANLKPRKLAGFMSNGMVMCVSDVERTMIKLIRPPQQTPIGERVLLQGAQQKMEQKFLKVLNPKKKILQHTIQGFRSDDEGYAMWNNMRLITSKGYIKTQIKNGKIS